ncbi:hypothetical protein BDQ12DRAFT_604550 [Crucibulum laeve]|uniref:Uncharacterized protein n=1 Tax=Crucibulum laeve TaxID=68775 RepID=A0A5C3M1A3_9AGAR|nr:hypothetical protein BDQ12DRAFT_604550 [Crucibulum laeve]
MSQKISTQPEHSENMGIVDGRPEGRQPDPAKVTVDTYVDPDASASEPFQRSAEFNGATSKDVHDHYGHPGSGITSQSRKREPVGISQWGPPSEKEKVLSRATRPNETETGGSKRG